MRKFTLSFLSFAIILSDLVFAAGSFGGLVIPNHGQVKGGEGVRYYMDAPWGRLYVTDRGLVAEIIQVEQLTNDPPTQQRDKFDRPVQRVNHRSTLLLDLPGACWQELVPEDPQITKLNFFYGNNPKAWVTNVPTYGRLRIKSLLPGADLVLEPQKPSFFRVDGTTMRGREELFTFLSAQLQTAGFLLPPNPSVGLAPTAPTKANNASSDSTQTNVTSQPQTILWGTYLGGLLPDIIQTLAVDTQDNVLVAGITESYDFPVPGALDPTFNGGYFDIFVAKLSSDGSRLLWGTYLGGSWDDQAYAMALDASGDIFITGATLSPDAPVSPGAFDETFNGYSSTGGILVGDIYAVRLPPAGDQLLFGTYIGSSGGDEAYACSITVSGDLIVAGKADLGAPVPGGFDTSSEGMYLAELSGNGSQLKWGTFLGGESVAAIALDHLGNIILLGDTWSATMPVPGGYDTTLNRDQDLYIAKISISENKVVWGTYLGGYWLELARALVLDSSENVIVSVLTDSADMPTPSGHDTIYNGNGDLYIAKLSQDGANLLWATYLGGSHLEGSGNAYGALLINERDEIIISDSTNSSDIFVNDGYRQRHDYSNRFDLYIGSLSAEGDCMRWGTFWGGGGADTAPLMAWDSEGNLVVAATTDSRDLPTPNGYDSSYNGPEPMGYPDGFIFKLTADPSPSSHKLYVAAAAHTPGAYGTQWRTDGMILNPNSAQVCYDLHLMLPGPSGVSDFLCESRCLESHSAWHYEDILATSCMISGEVGGSLRIESSRALLMTTRTYNQTETGTYGQFIEGVEDSQAITPGDSAEVIALKQNADFRTNLGFSEISGQPAEVSVAIFDSSGELLQNSSFTLLPYEWRQMSLPDLGISSLEVGRARITVVSGGLILAYASMADNRTGDAIYMPINNSNMISWVDDLMIPVVAHVEGAYDTHWQSDLYYYLVSTTGIDVTFTYTTLTAEYEKTFSLWKQYYFEIKDVVSQWFPEAGNSSGVLRLNPGRDFMAVTRTYNAAPEGTYGQCIPFAYQARFLGPAQSGLLLQLQCTPEFRTNVGFSEYTGADTAVLVDLYATDGTILGSRSYTVGAGKNLQVTDIFGNLGVACRYEAAYAEVTNISAGAIHAYASVVDNRTGDGIYIPAQKYLHGGCHE